MGRHELWWRQLLVAQPMAAYTLCQINAKTNYLFLEKSVVGETFKYDEALQHVRSNNRKSAPTLNWVDSGRVWLVIRAILVIRGH